MLWMPKSPAGAVPVPGLQPFVEPGLPKLNLFQLELVWHEPMWFRRQSWAPEQSLQSVIY